MRSAIRRTQIAHFWANLNHNLAANAVWKHKLATRHLRHLNHISELIAVVKQPVIEVDHKLARPNLKHKLAKTARIWVKSQWRSRHRRRGLCSNGTKNRMRSRERVAGINPGII